MTPTQWEQDYIHEEMGNVTVERIAAGLMLPVHVVEACVAQYGAFLRGEAPGPYLDGTRVNDPPTAIEKRLKTPRIVGGTNGEQPL